MKTEDILTDLATGSYHAEVRVRAERREKRRCRETLAWYAVCTVICAITLTLNSKYDGPHAFTFFIGWMAGSAMVLWGNRGSKDDWLQDRNAARAEMARELAEGLERKTKVDGLAAEALQKLTAMGSKEKEDW